MTIKLVYIAGPYRAKTSWQIEENIFNARIYGAAVAALGFMPVVPHANTANYDDIQDDKFWINGTMEILRRCDAVLMIPGFERSSGSKGEEKEALALGKPVFYSLEELKEVFR